MTPELIEKCIKYLYNISLSEPVNLSLEEIEPGRIVLSYKEKDNYNWRDKIYKEFIIENDEVKSMKIFNKEQYDNKRKIRSSKTKDS